MKNHTKIKQSANQWKMTYLNLNYFILGMLDYTQDTFGELKASSDVTENKTKL